MDFDINQENIIPLAKAAIAGDKYRFIRLGIVTITNIVGGRLAGEVVDSLLERMWDNSDKVKQEAEFKALEEQRKQEQWMAKVIRQELGEQLENIYQVLNKIEKKQTQHGSMLGDIKGLILEEGVNGKKAIEELRTHIDMLIEDKWADSSQKDTYSNDERVVLHVIKNDIKIPHYANCAEFIFSIHNFSNRILKIVEIQLEGVEKEQYDEVQLPREGQASENYELTLDLRNNPNSSFDLLDGVNAQFDLKPEEAEAFRLNIYCDDGYIYHGKLHCRLDDLKSGTGFTTETVDLQITYPITRIETLRERKNA
jgi:ribosomal 50S subunit-associated protein YjgA (DUF615 family)